MDFKVSPGSRQKHRKSWDLYKRLAYTLDALLIMPVLNATPLRAKVKNSTQATASSTLSHPAIISSSRPTTTSILSDTAHGCIRREEKGAGRGFRGA